MEKSAEKETKKGLIEEFQEFISRGNIVEIAVGLTVGSSFHQLVSSLVDNILLPPIGLVLGGSSFENLFFPLNGIQYASLAELEASGAPAIKYGLFIGNLLDFLIIALSVFFAIKVAISAYNRINRAAKRRQNKG